MDILYVWESFPNLNTAFKAIYINLLIAIFYVSLITTSKSQIYLDKNNYVTIWNSVVFVIIIIQICFALLYCTNSVNGYSSIISVFGVLSCVFNKVWALLGVCIIPYEVNEKFSTLPITSLSLFGIYSLWDSVYCITTLYLVYRKSNTVCECLDNNSVIVEFNDEYKHIDCVICLDTLGVDRDIRATVCKHVFHDECISEWMNTKNNCPVCRLEFTVEVSNN